MRKKYLIVSRAVNKVLGGWHDKGNGIILKTKVVRKMIDERKRQGESPLFHFNALHWTTKPGKAEGRVLCDCSNAEKDSVSLNTEAAKDAGVEEWGQIMHPTVKEIVRMICTMANEIGWENVRIWKMDVEGAFTLMDFDPRDVRLMSFEMTDELTYFPIAGIFGLTGMPFAFNVATKVLKETINGKIKGEMVMYVDDVIGISAVWHVNSDMQIAKRAIEGMFGPGTVASAKTDMGTALDVIGWNLDCSSQSFSMSGRNADRALYRFLQIDENEPVAIAHLETIASLASRYALVCREMKPYVGHLYASFAGMKRGRFGGNKSVKVNLSEEARHCIRPRHQTVACLLVPTRAGRRQI